MFFAGMGLANNCFRLSLVLAALASLASAVPIAPPETGTGSKLLRPRLANQLYGLAASGKAKRAGHAHYQTHHMPPVIAAEQEWIEE